MPCPHFCHPVPSVWCCWTPPTPTYICAGDSDGENHGWPCDFVEWDGVYKMSYTTWFGGQESHYARVYGSGDDRVAVLSNGWVLRGPHWGKYPSETDDIMVCKHCNRVLET